MTALSMPRRDAALGLYRITGPFLQFHHRNIHRQKFPGAGGKRKARTSPTSTPAVLHLDHVLKGSLQKHPVSRTYQWKSL